MPNNEASVGPTAEYNVESTADIVAVAGSLYTSLNNNEFDDGVLVVVVVQSHFVSTPSSVEVKLGSVDVEVVVGTKMWWK